MRDFNPRAGAAECGKDLRDPIRVIPDQGCRPGDDVPAAPAVASERAGRGRRKGPGEPLHAGQRCSTEAIDALVVIAHDADVAAPGEQFNHPLLREVGVLILVDQDGCKTFYIPLPRLGAAFEQPYQAKDQVVEVEHPLGVAAPTISAEKPDCGQHLLPQFPVLAAASPMFQPVCWNQLLLQPFQQSQERVYEIVRSLRPDQGRVAQFPEKLSHQDPPVGARQHPEAGWNAHPPSVLAQQRLRDRMEGADPDLAKVGAEIGLDPCPHLGGGPLGEGHDQDRIRRGARRDQTPETFGDNGGLAGSRTGDDPDRTPKLRHRLPLLAIQGHRTEDLGRFRRRAIAGPSAPSGCGYGGPV